MFFLLFLDIYFLIDTYFLSTVVIAQIFIPTAELVIPIGKQNNEPKAKIERQPVIAETKISKC